MVVFLCLFYTAVQSQGKENKIVIPLEEPTMLDPVSVGAMLLDTDDSLVKTVVLRAQILEGFHIYAYVSPKDPYINSKIGIELPEGVVNVGEMKKPSPEAYPGKKDLFVYVGEVDFKQNIALSREDIKGSTVTCWIYYQSCDVNMCLPPIKKEIILTL
ncbi:Disulphide bond corrector protein DsbC [Cellulophaga fucicola]|uniref:Disulphide bond corrector protein DsbC n=2 Tax=Cellulophaga fucicola TaxID=76595 RepID=A0A1K1MWV6_9FLAO|nr:Disulphide bond corrector protein DsbC [Cellulophaga fucicola]